MEIIITKDGKKELTFELVGAGHTLCTLLKEALYGVKGVEAVSYKIDHPLVGKPEFILITDGSIEPKEALKKAAKNIKSKNSKTEKSFIDAK